MELSPLVPFASFDDLARSRHESLDKPAIEALMIKRKDSPYVAGRPTGLWYKWKREPRVADAVLLDANVAVASAHLSIPISLSDYGGARSCSPLERPISALLT